jgi:hypothetical protein
LGAIYAINQAAALVCLYFFYYLSVALSLTVALVFFIYMAAQYVFWNREE